MIGCPHSLLFLPWPRYGIFWPSLQGARDLIHCVKTNTTERKVSYFLRFFFSVRGAAIAMLPAKQFLQGIRDEIQLGLEVDAVLTEMEI